MRKWLTVILFLGANVSFGQLGISFHQSNLPFVGVNYEIKDRFIPEIRIGTDNYFENTSLEADLMYKILKKEDFDFYGGVGARINGFTGVVIPVGLNIYPLTNKKFGFHIEAAPIIGEDFLLRGSWGIRYRFRKE
jgi:hypothetical protein